MTLSSIDTERPYPDLLGDSKVIQIGIPLLAFLISFSVFAWTTCPSVGNGHDTGEMITAACTRGIAHPPGYPLYVQLGYLWSVLLDFGRPDWRMNLFSGFCVSVGCIFLCDVVRRVTGQSLIGFGTALLFAFCRSVWRQSVIAEVFGLHWMLLCLLAWVAVLWGEADDEGRYRWMNRAFLLVGLCVAHHHTVLFALPGMLIYGTLRKGAGRPWGFCYTGVILFLVGWIPFYVEEMWRAQTSPYLNWGAPTTPDALRNHFLRKAYGTLSLSVSDGETGSGVAHVVAYVISLAKNQFPFPVILLAGLSLPGLSRPRLQAPIGLFFSWWLFQGPLFALYARQPNNVFYLDMQERFYASSYLGAAGLIGIGVYLACEAVVHYRKPIVYLFACLPLWSATYNWDACTEEGLWIGYETTLAQMEFCPQKTLFFPDGDLSCGVSEYVHAVEKKRQDLNVLFPGLAASGWGVQNLEPQLKDGMRLMGDSLTSNEKGAELCCRMHYARGYRVFAGNAMNFGIWLPRGVCFEWFPDEASKPSPEKEAEIQVEALKYIKRNLISGKFRHAKSRFWIKYSMDVWTRGLRTIHQSTLTRKPETAAEALETLRHFEDLSSGDLTKLAFLYKQLRNPTKAESTFLEALKLEPNNRMALAGLGDIYLELGRTEDAERVRLRLKLSPSTMKSEIQKIESEALRPPTTTPSPTPIAK